MTETERAKAPALSHVARPTDGLDVDRLRAAIREEYATVAADPDRGFHFHTGRPLARLLGYEDTWLEGVPEESSASFAGTGNPFSLGLPKWGERVVDVGSGAGIVRGNRSIKLNGYVRSPL